MTLYEKQIIAVKNTTVWPNHLKPGLLAWSIGEQGRGIGILARNAHNYYSLHYRAELSGYYPHYYLLEGTGEKDNKYFKLTGPEQCLEALYKFIHRQVYYAKGNPDDHMGSIEDLLRHITPAFCPRIDYVEYILRLVPEAETELRKVGWKPEEEDPMPEPQEPQPFVYTVKNGLLHFGGDPVLSYASPNYWKWRTNKPTSIVFHYTASEGYKGIASWFMNPASKVSAHLLICKNGNVIQFVPFHKPAWHSGSDQYNCSSIGIELENFGCSRIKIGGKVVFNVWGGPKFVDEKDCLYAAHRLEPRIFRWWPYFTMEQYAAINRLVPVLREAYGPLKLLGHDMLGVGKVDPGPALDWNRIGV